ncbi:DNA/RNA endonuclease G, NUC1 [Salinimicrobium catena]|uniref:DNA/RNA endonuclease G, NUC1 n=1 Tax=Salinimicrobium catena TaxID=390640 RepID=A0A1H5N365_9FLAO|nr:DNA/RNA non-specific endonuclease [Salinimicrobium catena]SDL35619.1 DNA/RNA endonuclease G, NUC1 [Salinimicrobium catena]SEE95983.1 DNA/RNA endonuclease G, NUC1 [Salinimicrobium catena]
MKHPYLLKSLFLLQVLFLVNACSPADEAAGNEFVSLNFTVDASGNYLENFENAFKNSYSAEEVSFPDGTWYFDEALLGTLSSDAKNGSQSVRLRGNGKISMNFDLTEGADNVSLSYAKFGKDRNTSFSLYFSSDGGITWQQSGSEILVKNKNLQSQSFPINTAGNVRFEIRKTDGTSERLNIDDILVEPFSGVVPGPGVEITEDYESGSKGSYAAGTVDLLTGTWFLDEALIGSLDNDRKTGTKSVRIRDYGTLQMNYDVTGATSVSFDHAVYGTDGASSWELQASEDSGASWTTVGAAQTTSATTLENVVFEVNFSAAVRFRIVKLSGSGDRINIDNFTIGGTQESSGGGDTGGDGSTISGEVHFTMGNPSAAVTDINFPNNYLLEKEEYVMSYSRDKGTANWVSWHLDEAWLGEASRQDDFRADSSLPAGWYQVEATDYQYSGFDRGHLCPSADRTLSVDDNSNTFFMTNMMPQAPNNNRIGWASLESYCRSMLSGGYEIYIISGGYGIGGDGSNGPADYIANGNVQVPSNTWKVIMIIPDGDDDVNRVTTSTQVIAVDMPNSQSVSSDWTLYQTSVDQIEAATGYDFFDLVPDDIEDVIEATTGSL